MHVCQSGGYKVEVASATLTEPKPDQGSNKPLLTANSSVCGEMTDGYGAGVGVDV